jgi:hypothetical protein
MVLSSRTPFTATQPRSSLLSSAASARIAAVIGDFEKRRKKRLVLFFVACAAVVGLAVLVAVVSGEPQISLFILFGGGILAKVGLDRLGDDFKDAVLPIIMAEFGFSYDRSASSVSLHAYKRILPSHSRAHKVDHFWGEREGIRLSMADLRLVKRSGKNQRTVFRGQIGEFGFPRHAAAPVYVIADKGMVGRGFEKLLGSGDRVRLEDPSFERVFDVFSSDQVAARYILTPTMMDRLVALERRFEGVQAVFDGDTVRLTLPRGSDLFEPGSFLTPIDPHVANGFVRDMREIFDFIEVLKLDAGTKV